MTENKRELNDRELNDANGGGICELLQMEKGPGLVCIQRRGRRDRRVLRFRSLLLSVPRLRTADAYEAKGVL